MMFVLAKGKTRSETQEYMVFYVSAQLFKAVFEHIRLSKMIPSLLYEAFYSL